MHGQGTSITRGGGAGARCRGAMHTEWGPEAAYLPAECQEASFRRNVGWHEGYSLPPLFTSLRSRRSRTP